MTAKSILVVDDEPDIRDTVQEILIDEGYDVSTAENAAVARELRDTLKPDLVLLDVWMPDEDGITVLAGWQESGALECPVVMMSGHGTVETAVEATRLGAVDFVEKPLSLQKLLRTVDKSLRGWNAPAAQADAAVQPAPMPWVGSSEYSREMREQLPKVASSSAPVLLTGPAGSLKHQLAQRLHVDGERRGLPYVVVRCDALDPRTLAVELFGGEHAGERTVGLIEQAACGTLFLQDVFELPRVAQKQLSACLASGVYHRVGGTASLQLDARVVASVDGEALADSPEVSEDLFYQLNVVPIRTRQLAEHKEDIPAIVDAVIDHLVAIESLTYRHMGVPAKNRLRHADWPGDLVQLFNLIKRLLILGDGLEITVDEVDTALSDATPLEPALGHEGELFRLPLHLPLREARAEFERVYLAQQLKDVDGRMGELATRVGMERTHLYRKLRSLGIETKRAGD
ncbi:MAG: sigma-54 dependent transcriptional regulator [Pseudomonadota bacterium]